YTRHPVVVAQMAATMQHLSDGRLALSIGKGIPRFLEKAGIDQKPTAVEECITVLRSLLAGDRTTLNGKALQIDGIRLRTAPLNTAVSLYAAAIGPAGWEAALRVADGVATIWSDKLGETAKQAMSERELPVAALIPFSLSGDTFPEGWHGISSPDELQERVSAMDRQGIDEVIVAYRDMADLEAAAKLIGV
ncbi:MAG: LLM class flavin-dependent oxidoreductase, partial [Deltaproteobacteria bacterium]|nr:LLM class flavin-dependent oxidoreductase [Deltaproteobacteria bacterium]